MTGRDCDLNGATNGLLIVEAGTANVSSPLTFRTASPFWSIWLPDASRPIVAMLNVGPGFAGVVRSK